MHREKTMKRWKEKNCPCDYEKSTSTIYVARPTDDITVEKKKDTHSTCTDLQKVIHTRTDTDRFELKDKKTKTICPMP